jgi:glyoxylase-like metal-dependent hydrolase (beta-lactamase superfamily II)
MLQFKTEKVTNYITRIFGFATELMYLIEGREKAALLDTGSGFGSLKTCVDSLNNKPLITLITHGHVDHAMGAKEFSDARIPVYMSWKDELVYMEHGKKGFRMDGLSMADELRNLDDVEYVPTAEFTVFNDLKDYNIFDLGAVTIQAYALPGHTQGSMAMLVKEKTVPKGFLLTGDACNDNTFLFQDDSLSVTAYRQSLLTFDEKTNGKYERVLSSHRSGELPLDIIDRVITCCDSIIAGNADATPFVFRGLHGWLAKECDKEGNRIDGGCGNIVYNKNKI